MKSSWLQFSSFFSTWDSFQNLIDLHHCLGWFCTCYLWLTWINTQLNCLFYSLFCYFHIVTIDYCQFQWRLYGRLGYDEVVKVWQCIHKIYGGCDAIILYECVEVPSTIEIPSTREIPHCMVHQQLITSKPSPSWSGMDEHVENTNQKKEVCQWNIHLEANGTERSLWI